jgi:hypothetical protein
MLAGARDAVGAVGLVEQHADLRAFEERHGVFGVARRDAVERVPGFGQPLRVLLEHAQLEVVAEPLAVERAGPLERLDRGGCLADAHRHQPQPRRFGR